MDINITDALILLVLATQLYSAYVSSKSRKAINKISRGSSVKLNNICKIVEKNEFGEWGRLGRYVRVGSDTYRKALETPGQALLHRTGLIEEGNQDDSNTISD